MNYCTYVLVLKPNFFPNTKKYLIRAKMPTIWFWEIVQKRVVSGSVFFLWILFRSFCLDPDPDFATNCMVKINDDFWLSAATFLLWMTLDKSWETTLFKISWHFCNNKNCIFSLNILQSSKNHFYLISNPAAKQFFRKLFLHIIQTGVMKM